jgi:hypothetical protein
MRNTRSKNKANKKDPNFDQNKISQIPYAIYVTRIPGHVTSAELTKYFSKFGPVRTCYISKRLNGKSAGYGYIVAADSLMFQALLKGKHLVGGRELVTMPFKNENSIRNESNHYSRRRICLSKVPGCLTPGYLKEFFEKIGELDNFFQIEPPKRQLSKRGQIPIEKRKYSY